MAARYPEMDWSAPNIAQEYKLFREKMELVLEDNEVTDEAKQGTKIKIGLGNEGLLRLAGSGLSDEDKKNPTRIGELFERQLDVSSSFWVHRLEILEYRQRPEETLEEFVTRCRGKGTLGDYTDEELRPLLVSLVTRSAPYADFRRELLDKPKAFSVKDLLDAGRKYEALAMGRKALGNLGSSTTVDAVTRKKSCGNCGLSHGYRCPAYNDTCSGCSKRGHWVKFCPGSGQPSGSRCRSGSRSRQGQGQCGGRRQDQGQHEGCLQGQGHREDR